ncbi:MAG: hypothetical protein ABIC68_07490 [Candidatus Omnitrophota bacterium]
MSKKEMVERSAYVCLSALALSMIFLISLGYCQNVSSEMMKQATELLGTGGMVNSNGIAGFTWSALIGGILFGCVGFVAFIYGKKNAEFKPMILGVLLMGYPYFFKNTIAVYVAGVVLTVLLFIGG